MTTSSGMPLASASSTLGLRPRSRLPAKVSDCSVNFGCTSAILKSAAASPSHASASAASANRRQSTFTDTRIIETVHARFPRQNLSPRRPRPAGARRQHDLPRLGMTREKRRQLFFVLHRKDRAGHVQKLTSGLEQGPQSLEETRLRRDEFGQVLGASRRISPRSQAGWLKLAAGLAATAAWARASSRR